MFHHYRRLIELRHHDPVVVDGRFELLLPDHEQLWVFTRTLGEQVLLVVANCSSSPAVLKPDGVPAHEGAELVLRHARRAGPGRLDAGALGVAGPPAARLNLRGVRDPGHLL